MLLIFTLKQGLWNIRKVVSRFFHFSFIVHSSTEKIIQALVSFLATRPVERLFI